MNAQILLRIIWKECRQLVPIDLAILIVGSMIGMGLSLIGDEHDWVRGLAGGIIFSIPVIALVNGVLAFSPENDNRTIRFLQTLPISGRKLAGMKLVAVAIPLLAFGLLSAVFLFGNWVWEIPYVIDSMPLNFTARDWYSAAASTWWLMFVTACIASIFLRHSIFALCATPVIVLAISFLISLTSMRFSTPGDFFGLYFATACRLALLVTGAIWISVTLGDRWLRDDPWIAESRRRPQAPSGATRTTSKPDFAGSQFQRLFWQSCRVSAWPIFVFLIGFAVLSLVLQVDLATTTENSMFESDSLFVFLLLALQLMPMVFAGLAATIFWPDQRRRTYRFFQQHPVIAKKLWLARIAPWLVAALIAAGFMVFVNQIELGAIRDNYRETNEALGFELRDGENWSFQIAAFGAGTSALLFVFAVGFGQLFSIFFRSPILAFFCATACELFLLGFSWYLTRLGTSPALILLIPLVILFSAGLWLLPKWINERLFTRHRLAVIAFGIIGVAAAIGVLAGLRSTEISRLTIINPNLPPPPEIAALLAEPKVVPPERAELIRNLQTLDPIPFAKWMSDLIASLKDKSPAYVHGIFNIMNESHPNPVNSPIDVVGLAFDANLAAGNLEDAGRNLISLSYLQNFSGVYQHTYRAQTRWLHLAVSWAEANGQSAEAIQRLIKELESQADLFPQLSILAISESLEQLKPFSGAIAWIRNINVRPNQDEIILWLGSNLPWEISRNKQLLRLNVNALAWHWRENYRVAWRNHTWTIADIWTAQSSVTINGFRFRNRDIDLSIHSALSKTLPISANEPFFHIFIQGQLMDRRFGLIRLALAAYRIEHGEYPDSLEKLSSYFSGGLPKDPATGDDFVYFPHGLDGYFVSKWITAANSSDSAKLIIEPHTPILFPSSKPISQQQGRPNFLENDYPPRDSKLYTLRDDYSSRMLEKYFRECQLIKTK